MAGTEETSQSKLVKEVPEHRDVSEAVGESGCSDHSLSDDTLSLTGGDSDSPVLSQPDPIKMEVGYAEERDEVEGGLDMVENMDDEMVKKEEEDDDKPTVLQDCADSKPSIVNAGLAGKDNPRGLKNGVRRRRGKQKRVQVKDEPVDEEYDQALPPADAASEHLKDEPETTEDNLKISAVISVGGASSPIVTTSSSVLTTTQAQAQGPLSSALGPASAGVVCAGCKNRLIKGQVAYRNSGCSRLFCSAKCLTPYNSVHTILAKSSGKRTCHYCLKELPNSADLIKAPVDAAGTIKDFCGQDCLFSFNFMTNSTTSALSSFSSSINVGTQDTGLPPPPPNSVRSLLQYPFEGRTLQKKLQIKELGPDQPDIKIRQQSCEKGRRSYMRGFSQTWYKRKPWLAGCSHVNALFCFPCLLFKSVGTDVTPWTVKGVRDVKHLTEKSKRHECTRTHLENTFKLAMLGRVKVAVQLDDGHRIAVRERNKEVEKNRHILSKMIDCVKFCGAFELALRGHNETEFSDNPGVFKGLVDLVASLDSVLKEHLENATVFKGTLKTVQNELLDCMLSVLKDYILEEVKSAEFVSVQTDETTDISTNCQLVLVLRYIDTQNNVQERFFEFIPLQNATPDTIATALLERLSALVPRGQESRLIAQAYDGAAVMRGADGGVQRKVTDVYGGAHYVHSYAHPLDLVVQQATSHIPRVRTFFSELGGFATFFAQSAKRAAALDQAVALRLPGTRARSWNFRGRTVDTVHEHKDDLLQCFQNISDCGCFDPPTVREAGGFVRMLEDEEFCFFLALFHKIMPHVDTLFKRLQKRNIDSAHITGVIQSFTVNMQTVRDSMSGVYSGSEQEEQQRLATEVCDTVLSDAKERFSFTKHLISATLLLGDLFPGHDANFPESALDTTVEAYPVLNKAKLRSELSLIYEHDEFKSCSGALTLFQFFMENDLQGTFTETVSLLRILITTPMTTAEPERCFPTLKRIKAFLRNTVTQDRLNALAMLSMEKNLIRNIPDFNNRVIERFATQEFRREKFLYK